MQPQAYSYLRMSTDEQRKGDSLRRQLDASKAYAEAHGLDLADEAQLQDIGVSAFKGKNVRDGALGRFLAAVEKGNVPRGSFLLVEALDRLSREEVRAALSRFLRIGEAGITIVTLMDGRIHRPDDSDVGGLMMSLMSMHNAHEESLKKSERVGAAWKNKRALAAKGKPMTRRCPGWLRMSPDRTHYEVVAERAEIVRRIFDDYISGIGTHIITKRLNDAGVPAFEGENGWHRSSVKKVLVNRAAIGEFQPHVKREGQRVPEGDAVSGYYPAIIDETLFYRAQDARLERATRSDLGAGRKGQTFSNLFTNLARCAYCHSPMVYENKGQGSKGGTYLVCDGVKRRRGCTATRWRYKDFEVSFLAFVTELDAEAMINEGDEARKRRDLEAEVSATQGELSVVEAQMQRTYDLLATGAATDFVSGKLRELEERRKELTEGVAAKRQAFDSLGSRVSKFYHSKAEVRSFVESLQQQRPTEQPEVADVFKLRANIASRLRTLVESLVVAPLGDRPKVEKTMDFLRGQDDATDVLAHIEARLATGSDDIPYFAVGFRNGTVRAVYPSEHDPLEYRQQVVATKESILLLSDEVDPDVRDLLKPSKALTAWGG
jgi:DNA invertase Pin-like site-specific DNA recombinase